MKRKAKKALLLTHFQPMFHFYTSWKPKVFWGFPMFSGGIEVENWLKIGYTKWLVLAT